MVTPDPQDSQTGCPHLAIEFVLAAQNAPEHGSGFYMYCFGNFQGRRYSGMASFTAFLSPTIASLFASKCTER